MAEELTAESRPAAAGAAVAAGALAITLGMLPAFLVGGLVPFIRGDFPVTSGQLGVVVGCFFGASALGALSGGQLVRRVPFNVVLRACAVVSVVVAVPVAALANSVVALAVGVAAAGMVNGVLQPSVNLVLRAHLRPVRLGRAIGVKQAAGPGAALLVGLAIPGIGATVGWRWSYALVPLIAVLVLLTLPSSRGGRDPAPQPHPARTDRSGLFLLAAGSGCGTGTAFTAVAFLVQTLAGRGMTVEAAGLTLASVSVVNIGVLLLSGALADRWPALRRPMAIGAMFAAGAVGYTLVAATGGVLGGILGACLAIPLGWGWHALLHLIVMDGRFGEPGPATGAVMSGVFTGGLLVPLLYGSLEQAAGTPAAWVLLAAIAAGGAATMWVAERRQR